MRRSGLRKSIADSSLLVRGSLPLASLVGPSCGAERTATGKLRFALMILVNRKLVGALLAVAGVVLIVVALLTAYQNCPASTYNGTGPPPPTPPCTGHYSWTAFPLLTFVVGILLVPSGAIVAFYRRG